VHPTRVLPQVLVGVKEDLTLKVRPIRILEWEVKELRNKRIPIVKVLWRSTQIKEETWERDIEMRKKYPKLFKQPGMECETSIISRMKFILKGENVKLDKNLSKRLTYAKQELMKTN